VRVAVVTTTGDLTRRPGLAGRADLTDLLTRQGLWLDERRFDDTASVSTSDATAETPGGLRACRPSPPRHTAPSPARTDPQASNTNVEVSP